MAYECKYHCSRQFESAESLERHYGKVWAHSDMFASTGGIYEECKWLTKVALRARIGRQLKSFPIVPTVWLELGDLGEGMYERGFEVEAMRERLQMAMASL